MHRFTSAEKLCSWAGLIPRHYDSGTHPEIAEDRVRIDSRRGKNIAKIAAARKLLTLVCYGLRKLSDLRTARPRT